MKTPHMTVDTLCFEPCVRSQNQESERSFDLLKAFNASDRTNRCEVYCSCAKRSMNVQLCACYLIKESVHKLLETLCTCEALLVIQLAVTVHHLLRVTEAALAALTDGIGQCVCHVAEETRCQTLLISHQSSAFLSLSG